MAYLPIFVAIIIASGTLIGAFIASRGILKVYNEGQKNQREFDEFQRKESMYSGLIKNIIGYAEINADLEMRKAFLQYYNLSWMYCSDEVILKLTEFIISMKDDKSRLLNERIYTPEERKLLVGELILEIRKDLINRKKVSYTSLNPEQFQILVANPII